MFNREDARTHTDTEDTHVYILFTHALPVYDHILYKHKSYVYMISTFGHSVFHTRKQYQ